MSDKAGTTCLNCRTYSVDCRESAVRESVHCCAYCSHRHSRYERRFSAREVQIIRSVAREESAPQIAAALGISVNTLDTRLRSARRKTRYANRYELAAAVAANAFDIEDRSDTDPVR